MNNTGLTFNYSLLIDLVKEFPAIYDAKNEMYRNRDYVQRVWRYIAKKLGTSESICKEKWANLRSNFMREMRKVRARSMDNKPKKITWRYYNSLSFLCPTAVAELNSLLSENSLANQSDDSITDPLIVNVVEPIYVSEYEGDDNSPIDATHEFLNNLYKEEKYTAVDNFNEDFVGEEFEDEINNLHVKTRKERNTDNGGHLKQLVDALKEMTKNSVYDQDSDKLFALSLVPFMKKLPIEENMEFRIQVQNLLQDKIRSVTDEQNIEFIVPQDVDEEGQNDV